MSELAERPSAAVATTDGDSMLMAVLRDPERLAAIPIETVERLIALRERMEAEHARRAYFDSMSHFQSLCPTIVKRRAVKRRDGGILYRYAPLDETEAQTRELRQECGFSHRFDTRPLESGGTEVCCVVTHRLGHSERTCISVPATKGQNTNAAQDAGIGITYGRRYAFEGAFGIVTSSEDIDAQDDTPADLTTGEDRRYPDGSSAKDVRGKVKEAAQRAATTLLMLIDEDDKAGALQVWEELQPDAAKAFVWSWLTTRQHEFITAARQEAA